MSFANVLENNLLDKEYGASDYTPPATLYAALSTTTPADDGTNVTEPSGNNYSRVAISNNKTTGWNAASAGLVDNKNDITFPVASGSWGTITYILLYDAVTAGTMRSYGALAVSKTIGANDQLVFSAGDLDVTLD